MEFEFESWIQTNFIKLLVVALAQTTAYFHVMIMHHIVALH